MGIAPLETAIVALAIAAPISVGATNAAMVASGLAFLHAWRRGAARPVSTPLDGVILAGIGATFASCIASQLPLASVADFRAQGHWVIFWIVASAVASGARADRLQKAFLVGVAIAAIHGISQIAFSLDLLHDGKTKASGFYNGHLPFGHVLVLGLATALGRFGGASRRERLGLALLSGIVVAALAASAGRGPWLAAGFVLLGWILWDAEILQRLFDWKAAIAVVLVLLGLQAAWIGGKPGGLSEFYRSYVVVDEGSADFADRERLFSNLWRVTMWTEGLRLLREGPALGIGPDGIKVRSLEFETPFYDFRVAHLHSNYLETLVTRGFVGLVALLWFLLRGAAVLARAGKDLPQGPGRAAVFGAIAVILAHAVHGHTYFSIDKAPIRMTSHLLLGLGVGVLLSREGVFPRGPSWTPRAAVWGASAVLLSWAVAPLGILHPGPALALGAAAVLHAVVRRGLGHLGGALVLAYGLSLVAIGIFLAPSVVVEEWASIAGGVSLAFGTVYGLFRLGSR